MSISRPFSLFERLFLEGNCTKSRGQEMSISRSFSLFERLFFEEICKDGAKVRKSPFLDLGHGFKIVLGRKLFCV